MTIKGTLETFNLRELLQMLAFNRKVGTLLLETERGPRTLFVDNGRLAFLQNDPHVSRAFLRRLRRQRAYDPDRLDRAEEIHRHSGRFVGDVLVEMGLLGLAERNETYEAVVGERLFRAQLTAIQRFEFIDGKALRPDGEEGEPIDHPLAVDALLLDLTRRVDHWSMIADVIPTTREVYEGTGAAVDLEGNEDLDPEAVDLVVPCVDGCRNVEQITEAANLDLFTAAQVLAELCTAGAIRPVATADLVARARQRLARGEALGALPLLRRGIEREDAPRDARLLLAQALEASGEPAQAAHELETFAALGDGSDAPAVFQALLDASRLRAQDLAAAGRACDYYLRHRPWLREMAAQAVATMRELLHRAHAAGRPREAAPRLAGFIEAGDLPSEDLLTLAELYASGGEHLEAASALYRRAEDLLLLGRTSQAKALLKRVLEHDPSRADARRRLLEVDGADRRRRQRARVLFVLVLLGLVVVGAGASWWVYSRSASREIGLARERAERSVQTAEAKAEELLQAFRERARLAGLSSGLDLALGPASQQLVQEVREAMSIPQGDLALYASELESYTASGQEESHRIILRSLETRRQQMIQRAERAVAELALQAATALQEAHDLHQRGSFEKSRVLLRRARNLAIADPAVRQRAEVLLEHVDSYYERFARHAERIEEARSAGRVEEAFQRGCEALEELLDSDLTRTLRFPVRITTDPEGAQVLLGAGDTGLRTPCVLEYSPLEADVRVRLRLPGRTAYEVRLPTFAELKQGEPLAGWKPNVSATLPPGVRWASAARFSALWEVAGALVAVDASGVNVYALDRATGGPTPTGLAASAAAPLRDGGRLPGKVDWRFVGSRTLTVLPGGGTRWEFQAMGRLSHPPLLEQGVVVLVDDNGVLYGLDALTGQERWRTRLDANATQPPVRTALGVVIATRSGAAVGVDLGRGALTALAPAARGDALALPLGDAVAFLGGGAQGFRLVHRDGTVEVRGDAAPDPGTYAAFDERGVAWIEGGRVRAADRHEAEPYSVPALGTGVRYVGAAGPDLYGLHAEGWVRAAQRGPDGALRWELKLEEGAAQPPATCGDALFVRTPGWLFAIER